MAEYLIEDQQKMIDFLLEGRPKTEIAKTLNRSRNTIYTWLELPQVKEELEKRQVEIRREAKTKIATKLNTCINNIYELAMNSKDQRVKLQANKVLLEHVLGTPTNIKENTDKEVNTITVTLDNGENE